MPLRESAQLSRRSLFLREAEYEWLEDGHEREWKARDAERDLPEQAITVRHQRYYPYVTHDVWHETRLSREAVKAAGAHGAWTVAYRIVPDRRGRSVIGEVRIFPTERRVRPNGWEGRWAAEVRGSSAHAPTGGVTSRLVRAVKLNGVSQAIAEVMARVVGHDELSDEWKKGLLGFVNLNRETLSAMGMTARDLPAPPKLPPAGRRRSADLRYAELARDYSQLVLGKRKGTRPIRDLAKRRGVTPAYMSVLINRARQRGMLTTDQLSGATPGKAGGILTNKAVAVLAAAGKKTKYFVPYIQ